MCPYCGYNYIRISRKERTLIYYECSKCYFRWAHDEMTGDIWDDNN